MASAASLFVRIGADLSGLQKGLAQAESNLDKFGSKLRSIGAGMTLAVSTPIVAAVGVAVNASNNLNAAMANIDTMLPKGSKRVYELRDALQSLAERVGKSATTDLAPALYQITSAFGDSAESMRALESAAKAGRAGVSSTLESVNLGSSVVKAYGLTVADFGKIMDKAFKTVTLGQTTFSELAGAIGQVAPLAAAAGVSIDDLFTSFATLAGVTGGTAEVATQLRSAFQAFVAPSDAMGAALLKIARNLEQQGKLAPGAITGYRTMQAEVTRLETSLKGLVAAQEATLKGLEQTYKNTVASIQAEAAKTGRIFGALAGNAGGMLDNLMRYDSSKPAEMFERLSAAMAESQRILSNSRGDMGAEQYNALTEAAKRAYAAIEAGKSKASPTADDHPFWAPKFGSDAAAPDLSKEIAAAKEATAAFDALARAGQDAPSKAVASAADALQAGTDAATKRFDTFKAAFETSITAAKTEMDTYGKSVGEVVIKAVGLQQALALISAEAGGNKTKLAEMFGSVEALTAALQLGKAMKEFAAKSRAMASSTGSMQEAYDKQSKGINSLGFAADKAAQKIATMTQELGEKLMPRLLQLSEILLPLFDRAEKFIGGLDTKQMDKMVTALAGLAALGPALVVAGAALTVMGLAISPKGLLVLGLIALEAVYMKLSGKGIADIPKVLAAQWKWLSDQAVGWWDAITDAIQRSIDTWNQLKEAVGLGWDRLKRTVGIEPPADRSGGRLEPSTEDNMDTARRAEAARQAAAAAAASRATTSAAAASRATTSAAAASHSASSRGVPVASTGGAGPASRGPTFTGPITVQLPNVTRPDQFARALYGDLSARTGR